MRKVLRDWTSLNDALREADEKDTNDMLKAELKGQRRKQFCLRIHSRMNKMRAARERAEIRAKLDD